jgi:hypothetical protein
VLYIPNFVTVSSDRRRRCNHSHRSLSPRAQEDEEDYLVRKVRFFELELGDLPAGHRTPSRFRNHRNLSGRSYKREGKLRYRDMERYAFK